MRVEIKCINKSSRLNPHERILYIGGINPNGTRWKVSQERAIEGIEQGKWQFFVKQDGVAVDVIVSRTVEGRKYIKTKNDGLNPNNLLSLPECP